MRTMAEKAEIALRMVREAPLIAYDTETSGLDWKVNQPIGYVITDPTDSIYIPVRHGGGGNLMDPNCGPLLEANGPLILHQFEVALAKAFKERERRALKVVGHNLKFDLHFSANAGIEIRAPLYDTQITAAILDEFMRSFSLDACAARWGTKVKQSEALYELIHRTIKGAKEGKASMSEFWRTAGNAPEVDDYAAGDGVSTLELFDAQVPAIAEEDLQNIFEMENRLIRTVFKMERTGVRVDPQRVSSLLTSLTNQTAEVAGKLPKDFNPRSSVDVKKYMEGHGHNDPPRTEPSKKFPEGQPSYNEKWLKTKPEGRTIIEYRQLTNLRNSFIDPLVRDHIYKDRVHTSFNQMKGDDYGTISGRFSSSGPNMQQVPKRNKALGRPFRNLFVPDDGMQFVEADYSQCEPRLFAHYSQDENLLAGYNSVPFRDSHQVVADLLGVERDPTAKRMNMGIFTGMQKKTFSEHMGWPIEEASVAFDKWMHAFPKIPGFQNDARSVFRNRGYVKTIYGRRCRLDSPQHAYKAASRIIQGSNADVVKYKLIELDDMFEASDVAVDLLLTVHDSFGWQCELGERGERLIAEAVKICEDVQSAPFNLRVPFVMDVGAGSSWGEATYGPV